MSPVEGEHAAPPILLPPPATILYYKKWHVFQTLKAGMREGREEWEVTFGSKRYFREATVKKLKGARLRVPSRLIVEVQAIGRGTTEPISSL